MNEEERKQATESQRAEASAANTKSYAEEIRGQYDAYAAQQQENIDHRVQQDTAQAQRAYEDQIGAYQKQYRDYTKNMYQGMDNAALQSRVNGQFGGMATAQAGAVRNAYQNQRQQLSLRQQKLATDTLREIEDLRAQGAFDKADALLQARQQEFQALYEDAVRVDENKYGNEVYQNDVDREQAQNDRAYLQQLGQAFMSMGVMPSESMLVAMGLDQATAQSYINAVKAGY